MANNDKNFKVKNGLDVKGSATVDNDLLVSGTLTAKTNTPSADSDVVNKAYVDAVDTHDSAAVQGQINTALAGFTSYDSDAVDAQIDSAVTQSFVDALNVNADRLDDQHGAYYLDYNNFTNTPSIPAQTISYDSASELADSAVDARTDQDLFTTSDVEFAKVTSNLVGSVHFTAKNDEGTALAKGDVVYLKGISGNTPTVAKADADDATKMPAFGVVHTGANSGANVTITTLSVLDHFDTQTPGWSEGDTLYVSTVAGQLTNTKPTGESSLIQNMGHVTKVDTTNGQIKVVGAGRTAATPNLDLNRIFIGNASNQAITMSLDSAVDSDHVQSKIKQSFIDTFDTHDSAAVAGQINSKFANDATFSKDLTVDSDLTVNGVIKGPSTFIIDPALHGDSSGTLVILGNLQVDGVSTVIQSNTVSITDKNIVLADSATNATEANGAGITVNGANASITYVATGGEKWEFNKAPYYLTNRLLTTADDTHDSAAVVGQINLEVDQAFVNALNVNADQLDGQTGSYYLDYNNFTNTPTIPSLGTDYVDSAEVNTLIAAADTHDSAAVVGQINLEVDKAFVDALAVDYNTLSNKPTIPALGTDYVDSAEVNTLIAAADTHDSAAVAGQIADTLNDTVTITKHSTTDPVLKLQSTVSTSNAAPIMEFVRNTDQANNGDYLGQIKFLGEDSSGTADGSGIVYAKMTGKIADPTDGTEDGLIEYMVKSNGSNLIMARMTGNSGGKLIMENGAGIEVASGNITIAGNTVLTTASDTHDSAAVEGQIDANFASGFTVGGDITFSDSDDLIMPDNSRIKLGDDADLQIYHSGTNSFITEVGPGDLNINAQNLNLADGAPNFNYYFRGIAGQDVRLYYNGSQKLNTTSTGVDVTGTVTADGLTVDTDTLYVDATNDRVGIGTTGPSSPLHVYHATTDTIANFQSGDTAVAVNFTASDNSMQLATSGTDGIFKNNGAGNLRLFNNGAERMRINSSGNVGINSTTPEQALHVEGQVVVDGGTGVSSTGVLHVRQNGDTSGNGITITSSNAISHRIWKSAGGVLSFGPSTDPDAFTQDLNGNITVAGEVFVDTLTPSTDSALASKAYVDANSGGGGSLTVKDEGSALATAATTLNFVGAGVTASGTGAEKTITISGGGGSGASSTFSLALSTLDSSGRTGTNVTTRLGVGDPVYYDSDAGYWTGAVDSADGVASHVIVKYNTSGSTFEIAQSGIHDLDSDGSSPTFDANSYYFLSSTDGVPTTTQPINGIYQSLYYALDNNTIDVNIAEAQDITASSGSAISGTSAAAPVPSVHDDPDTGLFSGSTNTLSIAAGGTEISSFSSTGLEVKSGVGIPNYVSLSQGAVGAGVTYNIDAGNTASLTTDSDKTITFTTTGGDFTGLGGTGVTLLIKNNTSPDSDRTMTFVTSSGNTLHFNSANTLTVNGGKISIVSAMVFGDNDIILSASSLDSSVTY